MAFLQTIGYYLSDHLAVVLLGIVGMIFLMFFFVAIDLFNIRKEAIETNIRIAEMSRKMTGMNNGIQELIRHFVSVTQDVRVIKDKAETEPTITSPAPTAHKTRFEDYVVNG